MQPLKIIRTSLTCLAATCVTALGLSTPTIAQENLNLSSLESGTYFAQGSMYSRSYRVIAVKFATSGAEGWVRGNFIRRLKK